jgi:hypothetical protein
MVMCQALTPWRTPTSILLRPQRGQPTTIPTSHCDVADAEIGRPEARHRQAEALWQAARKIRRRVLGAVLRVPAGWAQADT